MSSKKKNGEDKKSELSCSFCGKDRKEVDKMIAGLDAFICDKCITSCREFFLEQDIVSLQDTLAISNANFPTPQKIKSQLDEYVVGQDQAKKILATAAYNHYKRLLLMTCTKLKDITNAEKSNVLMLGPTGCGKTLLAKTLAKILNVPFAIVDATALTEAGYVGGDVNDIIYRLLGESDQSIELAECGIVYIDEIDKISHKGGRGAAYRDVGGEGVQQALLKLIEGAVVEVPSKNQKKLGAFAAGGETLQVDTKNILFICGGAFVGIEKIVDIRTNKKALGFVNEGRVSNNNKEKDIVLDIQVEDLINFGLIPEFVGRIPIIATLSKLDEADLVRILTEPKDALTKQYEQLFRMEKVDLTFTKDGLSAIAQKAIEREIGARGLRAILESTLLDYMFTVPEDKLLKELVINRASIDEDSTHALKIYNNNKKTLDNATNI